MTARTHITVVLDRTGSMQDIREDVIGGFNAFLAQQQALPDPATFSLVQFDSQDPYEVLQAFAAIASVPPLTLAEYVPRASTPLYDAMGRGILDLESQLAALPDSERPQRVVFVVVTDGQENASQEFNRERVTALVEGKKQLGWDFVFLSADLAAFHDAGAMGITSASRLLFTKSKQGNDRAWAAAAKQISELRSGVSERVEFDAEDRRAGDA